MPITAIKYFKKGTSSITKQIEKVEGKYVLKGYNTLVFVMNSPSEIDLERLSNYEKIFIRLNENDTIELDFNEEHNNNTQLKYYDYYINPSNIQIRFSFINDMDTTNLHIKYKGVHFIQIMSVTLANELRGILDNEITRQLGRTIGMIPRIAPNENTDSVIASYLTGNTGSLRAQMNKLKMRTGVPLAPRAGGKRKTKKNRRN